MRDSEEDLAHLMFRVYGSFHGSLFKAATPTKGLGRPELGLLGFLHTTAGATITEAADKCHMAKSQLSLIAERLVEKAMIERVRDSDDRRIARIKTTEAGEIALAEAFQGVRARVKEYFAPLSDDDRKTVRRAFEIMSRLVEIESSAAKEKCE
ncbi:MAG: MarR family winged helix-turn-helix transcriptional regulator [Rectinemataceae bacterium]